MEDKGVPFVIKLDAAKINVEWPILTGLLGVTGGDVMGFPFS